MTSEILTIDKIKRNYRAFARLIDGGTYYPVSFTGYKYDSTMTVLIRAISFWHAGLDNSFQLDRDVRPCFFMTRHSRTNDVLICHIDGWKFYVYSC